MNRFAWMWQAYPFQPDDVCCQKTNLGFVDSIWEIFGPLLAGIPNVMIPQPTVRDPELFLQTLARERVSRIVLVPSQLRALLEHAPNLGERVDRAQVVDVQRRAVSRGTGKTISCGISASHHAQYLWLV